MRTNESYPWRTYVESDYVHPAKEIKKTSRLPLIPLIVVALISFTEILPTSVFLVLVVLATYILHISLIVTP